MAQLLFISMNLITVFLSFSTQDDGGFGAVSGSLVCLVLVASVWCDLPRSCSASFTQEVLISMPSSTAPSVATIALLGRLCE